MNAHADLKETKYFTITDSEFYDNSFTCIIICKQTLSNNSISNGIFGVWISHTLNEIDWRDGKLKKKRRNKLHYWTDKLKCKNKNNKVKRY